jgi:uncharacterized PurR-regulated membrane protein YhhQ (DUF165 family)
MNLLYYTLAAFIAFFATLIAFDKKKIWGTILSGLGVAGVVNANFFHAIDYPIDIFGWNFGFDAIIFTLYIFTLILTLMYYGKKQATIYTFSGSIAVLLAGIIELCAVSFSTGHQEEAWRKFGGFVISVIATIAAGLVIITVIEAIKKRHKVHDMWLMIIGIVLATLVNSTIYYSIAPFINGAGFDWHIIITSYFGKTIALGVAILVFGVMKLIEKHQKKKELSNINEEESK